MTDNDDAEALRAAADLVVAAQLGDPEAMYNLGVLAEEAGDL